MNKIFVFKKISRSKKSRATVPSSNVLGNASRIVGRRIKMFPETPSIKYRNSLFTNTEWEYFFKTSFEKVFKKGQTRKCKKVMCVLLFKIISQKLNLTRETPKIIIIINNNNVPFSPKTPEVNARR